MIKNGLPFNNANLRKPVFSQFAVKLVKIQTVFTRLTNVVVVSVKDSLKMTTWLRVWLFLVNLRKHYHFPDHFMF
jgi:hypothetical protein